MLFSKFETELLENQIRFKEKRIAALRTEGESEPLMKLSHADNKKLIRHFKKN